MTLDETIRRIREILAAGRWPDEDRELTATDRETLEWNLDLAELERIRTRVESRLAKRDARDG